MRNIRARFPTLAGLRPASTSPRITAFTSIHSITNDNSSPIRISVSSAVKTQENPGSRSAHGIPAEWSNTTYWVAFDPKVRGRMWSVDSGTHDLPRPKMWRRTSVETFKGGVCRSDDGGRTWKKFERRNAGNCRRPTSCSTPTALPMQGCCM